MHCAPCSVLEVHAHCRGAIGRARHIVPYPPFPVCLHPPPPDLCAVLALPSLSGWGAVGVAMGAGLLLKCCKKKNILRPRGAYPLWGRGGGSYVAARRGGLALHQRRDASTMSRSGQGTYRPSAAAPAFGRAVRASLVPVALWMQLWPAPTMQRARLPPPGGSPVPAPAGLTPVAPGGTPVPAPCVPRAPRGSTG